MQYGSGAVGRVPALVGIHAQRCVGPMPTQFHYDGLGVTKLLSNALFLRNKRLRGLLVAIIGRVLCCLAYGLLVP